MALYKSPYAAFQVLVRSESVQYHQQTGVEIGRTKALTAEFGTHGGEFDMFNPLTQSTDKHALIHGHFFDTEAAAERNGWTEEERISVENTLDKLCRDQPYLIAKIDMTPPPAPMPWPTYPQTSAKEIVSFAIATGLVTETLRYEQENENRATIVAALDKYLSTKIHEEVAQQTGEPVITLG